MATWSERLLSIDDTVQNTAWEQFFLNETASVEFLRTTPPEVVLQVCNAGQTWAGNGWDTTRCSKQVRALTGLAMVRPRVGEYLHAFLYSLCLCSGVDLPALELNDQGAEVAFRLADLWQGHHVAAEGESEVRATMDKEEQDEPFLWEAPVEPLPTDLARLVERAAGGERLQVGTLLEQLPQFQGLKHRAEDNNHRSDRLSAADKFLKSAQQKVLNTLRVCTAIHIALSDSGND